MPVTEEKVLVFYLKQGSSKAFEQLFLNYQKKLYHFCWKILKSKEESENLVQAVFMEIWENRKSIDEEKSFSGYLFKITKNKIYNSIRKRLNEQVYCEYVTRTGYPDDFSNDGYESKQMTDIFEKLIETLPDKRKEIFLLSRNKGFTYKEIAQLLKISENTVDTQIRNALDFLREQFAKLR